MHDQTLCITLSSLFQDKGVQALCPNGGFPFICAIRLNVCSSFGRQHIKKRAIQQEMHYICFQLSASRELPRWPSQKKVWQLHLEQVDQMENGADMG